MSDPVTLTPEQLVAELRTGRKMKPVRWTDSTIFKEGYCYVKDQHTFVEHTPHTIGCSCSPAIAGAQDAIRQFGDVWVEVAPAPVPEGWPS